MKKLLLAFAAVSLAAACADAPTAPAAPEAPVAESSSSAFSLTLALQGAPEYPGGNWYFGADMQNNSSDDIFDYYFTWTRGATVVKEGYGMRVYTLSDYEAGHDFDLEVEVTGPDGWDHDQISITTGPWRTDGTRQVWCTGNGC